MSPEKDNFKSKSFEDRNVYDNKINTQNSREVLIEKIVNKFNVSPQEANEILNKINNKNENAINQNSNQQKNRNC